MDCSFAEKEWTLRAAIDAIKTFSKTQM